MNHKKAALLAALPHTLPVMTGYLVLGAAYGILMDTTGYGILWVFLSSVLIYAGSMQFVSVSLLAAGFHPLTAFFMTVTVNARHIFYGISMLGKFRGLGKLKPYLIFTMTDETFSILCSTEPPQSVDKKWFYFFISFFDHLYWITGSLIGSLIGSLTTFDTKGIDFVLTALFVVIFINQWQATKNHLPAIIGIVSALLCRIFFGVDFIIPAMGLILLSVTLLKAPMKRGMKA